MISNDFDIDLKGFFSGGDLLMLALSINAFLCGEDVQFVNTVQGFSSTGTHFKRAAFKPDYRKNGSYVGVWFKRNLEGPEFVIEDGKTLHFYDDGSKQWDSIPVARFNHRFSSYLCDEARAFLDSLLSVTDSFFVHPQQNEAGFKGFISRLNHLYRRPTTFHFVLGAGINSGCRGCLGWNDLRELFREQIGRRLNSPSSIGEKITDSIFNINYGEFQILKDIAPDVYDQMLISLANCIDPLPRPDNSILWTAAEIVAKQFDFGYTNQHVLTFNYDNAFEDCLKELKVPTASLFKYVPRYRPFLSKQSFDPKIVEVIHSHGFIRKTNPSKIHLRSVVLTNEDYILAYRTSRSYSYSKLYNHLKQTCTFVGNSITDYEEQKVLAAFHSDYPSRFHYSLKRRSGDNLVDCYVSLFLLKLGIIPLWFNNYDEANCWLREEAGLKVI